jgi:hypothetical protein
MPSNGAWIEWITAASTVNSTDHPYEQKRNKKDAAQAANVIKEK